MEKLKLQSHDLKKLLPPHKELSDDAKAVFYSHWYYSAIRLVCSLDAFNSAEAICEKLHLPRSKVKKVLEFLTLHGLCVEKDGKLGPGPQSTHVGADSLLAARHHANWRERAVNRMDTMKAEELFFTSPVTIAAADIPKVRKLLVTTIEDAFKIICGS
jgi:hypothetical protein